MAALDGLAGRESSGLVLTYLASALQRLPIDRRWTIAEAIAAHGEFADDPVLPLMAWYGIEPAVPADPDRAASLVAGPRFGPLRRFIARRLTEELADRPEAVAPIVAALAETDDAGVRRDLLGGMADALRGPPPGRGPGGLGRGDRAARPRRRPGGRSGWPASWRSSSATAGRWTSCARSPLDPEADTRGPAVGDRHARPEPGRRPDRPAPRPPRRPRTGRRRRPGPRRQRRSRRRPALLLDRYRPPPPRREATRRSPPSPSRAGSAAALLDAIEAGRVDRDDVTPFLVRQMRTLGDDGDRRPGRGDLAGAAADLGRGAARGSRRCGRP